ncbi:MAG: hydroxymethylglutaryl-CoA lyase [Planctomycetes bacterium]|nr:hydroxymethylglutaryl-CoA lyase [Planctomycetota bacterium]
MPEAVHLVETLRDAWQGLARVVPTAAKVDFAQRLLDAGLRRLDVGSFVSPSRVPAMADTAEVLQRLVVPEGARLTALVASASGLQRLLGAPHVAEVLYPLSLSERFQRRNTERGREEAFALLAELTRQAHEAGRSVYATISMAFGNNEGDAFDTGELREWVARLHQQARVDRVGLADTTAQATPAVVAQVYAAVARGARWPVPGAHLHVTPQGQDALVDAALDAGVRDFDCALGGLGGCQFAQGAVSNVSTLPLVVRLRARGFACDVPELPLVALDAAARALARG